MKIFGKKIVGSVACAVVLATGARGLCASVEGDLQNSGSETRARGATSSFYVYSVQSATPTSVQVGPNDQVSVKMISGGAPVATPPAPTDSTVKIPIPKKGDKGTFLYYGPSVALLDQQKALIKQYGDIEKLQSDSGAYHSYAQVSGNLAYIAAGASSDKNGSDAPPPGKAAAIAYDPDTVAGGSSYDYQATIDGALQTDDSGSSVGLEFYALDSNTYSGDVDHFFEAGAPMNQTLWTLSISASGPILSTTSLQIDFELNPDALKEISFSSAFLSSLPGYSSLPPSAQAQLIDAQVDSDLMQPGIFSISGGTATISDYNLFPDNTTFTPYAGADVDYAEGVTAGVEETPIPGSWLGGLVLLGVLAGASLWRRVA